MNNKAEESTKIIQQLKDELALNQEVHTQIMIDSNSEKTKLKIDQEILK